MMNWRMLVEKGTSRSCGNGYSPSHRASACSTVKSSASLDCYA